MSINVSLIDGVQNSSTIAEKLYTSPDRGKGTRISAFTASLDTGTESYRVFIGTSAIAANEIIQETGIKGPSQDSPLELINHLIPAGSSIFVQISTASTITIRASGQQF
jgi:hypothetical protein